MKGDMKGDMKGLQKHKTWQEGDSEGWHRPEWLEVSLWLVLTLEHFYPLWSFGVQGCKVDLVFKEVSLSYQNLGSHNTILSNCIVLSLFKEQLNILYLLLPSYIYGLSVYTFQKTLQPCSPTPCSPHGNLWPPTELFERNADTNRAKGAIQPASHCMQPEMNSRPRRRAAQQWRHFFLAMERAATTPTAEALSLSLLSPFPSSLSHSRSFGLTILDLCLLALLCSVHTCSAEPACTDSYCSSDTTVWSCAYGPEDWREVEKFEMRLEPVPSHITAHLTKESDYLGFLVT